METANFTIEGMRCEGCARIIQNALERLDGVKTTSVSHESRTARVLFNSECLTRDRLVRVIAQAGYRVVDHNA